jgi:transcriptional regulator GlxA family with amidase domain
MYTVAAVLYPSALATSITLPMEILQAAGQMASTNRRGTKARLTFLLAAPTLDEIKLASGISLKPDLRLADLSTVDLLILPAIWRNPRPTIRAAQPWLEQLTALAASGTKICSVGTASFLLAETKLLRGKPATTHWNYFDQFAKRYPDVQLKTRHLITQSDDLYCVGSVNSIADVMVHIIEEWYGAKVAKAIENQFSPEIRRPFRSAAYQGKAENAHHDELVLDGQQWLQDHLGEKIRLSELSESLGISPRSLSRRFAQTTGYSPQAYLQTLRIGESRDLLRRSNLSISEIAWQVGLHDVSYFSKLFRQHCDMSPLQYRQAVRGKLFALDSHAQP